MKTFSLTRRNMIGLSAALTSNVALARDNLSLTSLLLGVDGESRVGTILAKHFQVGAEHRELVKEFYHSLVNGEAHTETAADFKQLKNRVELEEKFELYVVQEFAVTTNILMLDDQGLKDLQMI